MKGTAKIGAAQATCLDYPDRYCVYHWPGEAIELNMALFYVPAPA